jgi:hypothetical protein
MLASSQTRNDRKSPRAADSMNQTAMDAMATPAAMSVDLHLKLTHLT